MKLVKTKHQHQIKNKKSQKKKKNWVSMGRKGNLKKWSFQTKPN